MSSDGAIREGDPPEPNATGAGLWAMVAVIAVFVVGVASWVPLGLGIVDAPVALGSWPADVSPAILRQATLDGLQSCARSSDPSPPRCPQSAAAVGPVVWVLAGDPVGRAAVAMTGRSGTGRSFQVWGTYAMVTTGTTPVIASEGPYVAALTWNGSDLHLDAIRRGRFDTDQPPGLDSGAARSAARQAFDRCQAAPDPTLCPTSGSRPIPIAAPDTSRAAISYERATGVVHARGAFSREGVAGTYDAHETIASDGSLTCYLITYAIR